MSRIHSLNRYFLFGLLLWISVGYSVFGQGYTITTIAGGGTNGDGGPAAEAILKQPQGIAASWDGSIYIAEAGAHRIRRIAPGGIISTFAGSGVAGFSGDGGPAAKARLNTPYGVAADLYGNVYVADLGNARLRKVSQEGIITTVAGGGELPPGDDNENKPGIALALGALRSVVTSADGSVIFADFTGHRVFQLAADGTVSTVAGTGVAGFSGDGGPPEKAQLDHPAGLALSYSGLYVSDSQNGVVRRIANNTIDSVAHLTTPAGLTTDLLGALTVVDPAAGTLTRFLAGAPPAVIPIAASDITRALDGKLYVTDAAGGLVRTIDMDGTMRIAVGGNPGAGDGGEARLATLDQPASVAVAADGSVYIAGFGKRKVRKVDSTGTISTLPNPGTGGSNDSPDPSQALTALASSVSVDVTGAIYLTDSAENRVRVIPPSSILQVLAGEGAVGYSGDNAAAAGARLNSPAAAVSDGTGNVYIADRGNGCIRVVDATGVIRTLVPELNGPRGLALDGLGHLYYSEEDAKRVTRLDLGSGLLTAIAEGTWAVPRGLALDASGNLYVADTGRQEVVRVDKSGQVDVIAGTGASGFSGDGGAATEAQLSGPWDVATDAQGRVYIADLGNGRIRRLDTSLTSPASSISVVNAASLLPGPVAPGMQIAILNTGLLAGDAGSTVVLVNSIPAAVLRMDDTQIVVLIPPMVQIAGNVEIVVVSQKGVAGVATVRGGAASPGLFVDGTGLAAASNSDGIVSVANPASAGSLVSVFGTGLGLGDLPVTATVGSLPAEVVFAGAVPAFPGTFQVNLRMPAVGSGNAAIVVTVGGVSTQPGAVIAVR